MLTSSDFKDLLNLFKKFKVRYLVVGGYAVMKYSEPRFTKDLDLFIATDQDNAKSVFATLKEFGAPLENLTSDDFAHKGYFYQMGRPPIRVDIIKKPNNWMHLTKNSAPLCFALFLQVIQSVRGKKCSTPMAMRRESATQLPSMKNTVAW